MAPLPLAGRVARGVLVVRAMSIEFVNKLDISRVPRESAAHQLLEVAVDALGLPIRVPLSIARGRRDGPTFGITSTLHGNELNGIPVIHRLMRSLDLHALRGTVVCVLVANVPGYLREQRGFSDGVDLNHIMPGVPGSNTSNVYAHAFSSAFLPHFDYLVDLHTASFGRVNSVYVRTNMSDETTAEMAFRQRPQIIVHSPAPDRTLRGAAASRDIPAITVEIGDPHRFQTSLIQTTASGLRSVLAQAGMLPRRAMASGPEPVVCDRSFWMYTDSGGLLEVLKKTTDRVEEGEVVARLTDIFGQNVREYRAPSPGIVVGKSTNPAAQSGARILHLGVQASTPSGLISRASFEPRPRETKP